MNDNESDLTISTLPKLLIDPVSSGLHCRCPNICLPSGRHHYDLYLQDSAEYLRKVEERDRSSTAYREVSQELTEARRRLSIEQGRCDDLRNCNRNLLDDLDSSKDQCQSLEDECAELNTKIQTLQDNVSSLEAQVAALKAQAPEPKRKKTHHSYSISHTSQTVATGNAFVDALASDSNNFVQLPVCHISQLFNWICLQGTKKSIQKTIYFLDKTTCSTSSMLGTSWVHGLLPLYPKTCDDATHDKYDHLRLLIRLTVCRLTGIEGLFTSRHLFHNIESPSSPGTYDFTTRPFTLFDIDRFSEELVIRRCIDCGMDNLVFQSLFAWAYYFIHVCSSTFIEKAEEKQWIAPGYVRDIHNEIVASAAAKGGHSPVWPWEDPPVSFSNVGANFRTQYPNRFKNHPTVPPFCDGPPIVKTPYNRCHPDDEGDSFSIIAMFDFVDLPNNPQGVEDGLFSIDPSLIGVLDNDSSIPAAEETVDDSMLGQEM
jgi:hypothetical protein